MFVSVSLLLDYPSERPRSDVRPSIAVRRGLSEIGWNAGDDFWGDRAVGSEIDANRRDAARCKPV